MGNVCGCRLFCIFEIFFELLQPFRKTDTRSSESRLSSLFLIFGLVFWRVICTCLQEHVRHFVLELELLTNPAMPMLTTNCFRNWWITLERRSCPFCTQLIVLPPVDVQALFAQPACCAGFSPLYLNSFQVPLHYILSFNSLYLRTLPTSKLYQ